MPTEIYLAKNDRSVELKLKILLIIEPTFTSSHHGGLHVSPLEKRSSLLKSCVTLGCVLPCATTEEPIAKSQLDSEDPFS